MRSNSEIRSRFSLSRGAAQLKRFPSCVQHGDMRVFARIVTHHAVGSVAAWERPPIMGHHDGFEGRCQYSVPSASDQIC